MRIAGHLNQFFEKILHKEQMLKLVLGFHGKLLMQQNQLTRLDDQLKELLFFFLLSSYSQCHYAKFKEQGKS